MALPNSPPISINQICTEMQAPIGTPITSLVRGGAYTPNSSLNAAVPTAPPISVLDFLGASKLFVSISDHSIVGYQQSEENPDPPPAVVWDNGSATFHILNTGQARGLGSNGDNGTGTNEFYAGEWLVSGGASDFEVRATLVSGTLNSGTLDTWLNCGTSRSWNKFYAGVGGQTCVLTIELRPVGGAVMDSATITLLATRGA